MKKLVAILSLLSFSALGQAGAFEGIVTYKMTGKNAGEGREMTFSIKGDKFRTDIQAKQGYNASSIMDMKKKQVVTLMPDKKAYMVMSIDPAKMGASKDKGGKLVKTGKTETIAGYKAEEWIMEGSKSKDSIWGTSALGGWAPTGFGKGPNLDIPAEFREKGFFPLRMGGERGGMEATKVEKKSLSASLFEVPAGYEKMDDMGGMGGGMPPEALQKMKDAMKNMTPEQRKMMEQMMKGK